ncbi:MAG: HD domain-containing protein [Thioalkalivibrio sp.]|nr:HD domain-containing protein [Thioalkalivibrio sp.]
MLDDRIRRARILIVDDEAANIQLLRRILEPAGYLDIRETRDPTSVEALLTELRPDLVLLDLLMPVQTRTAELEDARLQTLQRLARAAEYRDDVTGHHTRRVGDSAARIAASLGWPRHEVEMIRLAAPLHDVGKIGIPDTILLSDGPLTPAQFEVMKSHCVIGADILSGSDVPLLRMAAEIALSHHERWDGQGYPYGLSGEEIPLAGRIVAVADTYDALTHPRPYKHAWGVDDALDDIAAGASERFDPRVVEAFRGTVSAATQTTGAFEW